MQKSTKANRLKSAVVGIGAAAVSVLGAGQVHAESAKFTATWGSDQVQLAAWDSTAGPAAAAAQEILGTIHVASQKELMIGVSGVAHLVTFTEAKGKNGGETATTVAEGALNLEVRVVPTGMDAMCGSAAPAGAMVAAPGALPFASRRQQLSVTVDLDVVGALEDIEDDDLLADMLDIEGDVTVALGLTTAAAHHFNFLAPDLSQGTYDVVACFTGSASGSVSSDDDGALGSGHSYVAIGKRMLTVEEVRAVRSDFIDM